MLTIFCPLICIGCETLKKLDLTINFVGEITSVESLRDNYNLREL